MALPPNNNDLQRARVRDLNKIASLDALIRSGSVANSSRDNVIPPVASVTPTPQATETPQVTTTPTVSPTITPTISLTQTSTPTLTPSITPTITNTPTISITPTITPTNTVTPSSTLTNTPTISITPSITPTLTLTPTITITPTISQTSTITPTPTISITPTITRTTGITPTSTISVTPTISITPSITPTITVTPSITPTITYMPPALVVTTISGVSADFFNYLGLSGTYLRVGLNYPGLFVKNGTIQNSYCDIAWYGENDFYTGSPAGYMMLAQYDDPDPYTLNSYYWGAAFTNYPSNSAYPPGPLYRDLPPSGRYFPLSAPFDEGNNDYLLRDLSLCLNVDYDYTPFTPTPTPTPTKTPGYTEQTLYQAYSIPLTFTNTGFSYNVQQVGSGNPTLTAYRGQNYDLITTYLSSAHPLALRLSSGNTSPVSGTYNNYPSTGSINSGVIMFTPNGDTPDEIIYQCAVHSSMSGRIVIKNRPYSPYDIPTPLPTSTIGVTPTRTPTPTVSITPSASAISVTPTIGVTTTPTPTRTPTPTLSAIPVTPTITPTLSITPTRTPTPTLSAAPSPTSTPTPTITSTKTPTPTPSITPTRTPTQTITPTRTPTLTPTRTSTPAEGVNCSGYTYNLGGTAGEVYDAAGVSFLSDLYQDTISFNNADPGGTPSQMLIYFGGNLRSYVDFASGRAGQAFCYKVAGVAELKSGTFTNGSVNL